MVGGLMFLVDTNVWLELLLEQARGEEVRQFSQRVEARFLAISEFSLYSIGVILTRLKKDEVLKDFLSDTIEDSRVMRIRLDMEDLKQLLAVRQQCQLDFDDAYQYVAAIRYGYTLVSFDMTLTELKRAAGHLIEQGLESYAKMNTMIPVILFIYARPDHLRRTLNCLQENQVPLIYAFSDGPRTPDKAPLVAQVREILRSIKRKRCLSEKGACPLYWLMISIYGIKVSP